MRNFAILILAVILTGCVPGSRAGPNPEDIRCFAAASTAMAADRGDTDAAMLMAYYLGRLESASPERGWRDDVVAELRDLTTAGQSHVTEVSNECIARMRDSIRASRRNG